MCLCIPLPFTFKRKARPSDLDNDSIYVNYASSCTGSSKSSSSSSSSSVDYLDPHDFASLSTSLLSYYPTTSTHATHGSKDSTMDTNDNSSTAVHRNSITEQSRSSRQDSAGSLSDLIAFSSGCPHLARQSEHFNSDAISRGPVHSHIRSRFAADSGYDASLDTTSIMPQTSLASAIDGPVDEASYAIRAEVSNQTLGLQTSNSTAERIQSCRAAELRLALLAVLRNGCANEYNNAAQPCTTQKLKTTSQSLNAATMRSNGMAVGCKKSSNVCNEGGTNNPSTCVSIIHPARDSSDTVSKFHNGEAESSPSQKFCAIELRKPHTYCTGVLSALEEAHLGHEERQAIIEGGCHGLYGLQLPGDVTSELYHRPDGDRESRMSSPCVKGLYDKPARFISSMPSAITPNGHRVPKSTAPRFSRRRCAAQYQQPRQPLPLVQRPSRTTATQSSSAVVQCSQQKAKKKLNSCSTGARAVTSTSSSRGLELPHSKPNDNCNSRKVKFEDGLQKSFSDTATKHGHQRKVEKDGEISGAGDKKRKPQSGSKFSSHFPALFRRHWGDR